MAQAFLNPNRRQSPSGRNLPPEAAETCVSATAVIAAGVATATLNVATLLAAYPSDCVIACRLTAAVVLTSEDIVEPGAVMLPLALIVQSGVITDVLLSCGVDGSADVATHWVGSVGTSDSVASTSGDPVWTAAPAGTPDGTFTVERNTSDGADAVACTVQVCLGPACAYVAPSP